MPAIKTSIKRTVNRLRNIGRQVVSFPKWLWSLAGLFLAICAPQWFIGDPVILVQRSGGLLQVGGIVIAVTGLSRIKNHFGIPGPGTELKDWGKRTWGSIAALFRPSQTEYPLPLSTSQHSSAGMLRIVSGMPPNPTFPELVKWLDERLDQLQSQMTEQNEQVIADIRQIREELKQEKTDRKAIDAEISGNVRASTIDNLDLELIGVLWLLAGVLFATFPEMVVAVFW